MAAIEHLVYGCKRNGPPGAGILARSTALTGGCASEVAALCERWAEPAVIASPHPPLLSMPLENRLPAFRGRLFLVARALPAAAAAGPALCHALVLTEAAYAGLGLNPYNLVLEGAFLERWSAAESNRLRRIELRPASLAPLVSPPPTERDAEQLEEALRQLLDRRHVLLPLAAPDEASDRFLALLLASLPLDRKRSLRFASFCTPGSLELDLAGVRGPDVTPGDWRRILLAADPVNLDETDLAHVTAVQRCLGRGDLAGLEQLGRKGPASRPAPGIAAPDAGAPGGPPDHPLGAPARSRATPAAAFAPVGAELELPAAPETPKPVAPGLGKPVAAVRRVPGREGGGASWTPPPARALSSPASPHPAASRAASRAAARHVRERAEPAPGGSGIAWGWVLLLALIGGLVAVVVLGLPRAGGSPLRPWHLAEPERAGSLELSEPIDPGLMYRADLARRNQPRGPDGPLPLDPRARATSALGPAADHLRGESRKLLASSTQDLYWPTDPARERRRLQAQGAHVLATEAEVRRLTLYQYSLVSGVPWLDLPDLGPQALTARWDSLALRDARHLGEAAADLGLGGLPAALAAARHRLGGLERLAGLWAEPRIRHGWLAELIGAASVQAAPGSGPALTAWREAAVALADLMREVAAAETRLSPALADPYLDGSWRPAPLAEARRHLREVVARHGPERLPPLVTATVAWLAIEDGLATAAALGDAAACTRLLDEAGGNLAYRFAPGERPGHLDRLRLEAVRVMVARGDDPVQIPLSLYPGGDRRATLEFLAASTGGGAQLRELAVRSPVPLLARLAAARAAAPDSPAAHPTLSAGR